MVVLSVWLAKALLLVMGVARAGLLPPISKVFSLFLHHPEIWVSAFESSCFLCFPSNLKTASHPPLTSEKQGKVFSMDCAFGISFYFSCLLIKSSTLKRVHRALSAGLDVHSDSSPFQTKRSPLLLWNQLQPTLQLWPSGSRCWRHDFWGLLGYCCAGAHPLPLSDLSYCLLPLTVGHCEMCSMGILIHWCTDFILKCIFVFSLLLMKVF